MSTNFLLVLALDFLGAVTAGRLESGAGDVGESFRFAAGLFSVDGDGVVNGEGSVPPGRLGCECSQVRELRRRSPSR